MVGRLTIQQLRESAGTDPVAAILFAQVDSCAEKQTRDGKRYLEVGLRDWTGIFLLRVWNDHPELSFCDQLRVGDAVAIRGDYSTGATYGLETRNWSVRFLEQSESDELFAGPPDLQKKQRLDFACIREQISSLTDPRLRAVCDLLLEEFSDRFRRSAGARSYHHARRGGLVEHTAQMMRAAEALCAAYPELNRDLLVAGVLFHDCGKMWENSFPKEGLQMPYDLFGELIGHVAIGTELVNRLWQKLRQDRRLESWQGWEPENELVRLHLLHLVAAHHGEKAFGAPVEPKTPEAFALHLIDNFDAKLEVMNEAYRHGRHLAPDVIERVRPLPNHIVTPLARAKPPAENPTRSSPEDG